MQFELLKNAALGTVLHEIAWPHSAQREATPCLLSFYMLPSGSILCPLLLAAFIHTYEE